MQAKFICIGFQKCGTTTLYDILKQHKDLVLTRDVKEPMYYRVLGMRALWGKEWYEKRYFGHVEPWDPRIPGEINAMLATTGCAKKIGKDFPEDTKLIFMMRNPVDRTYSAYKYFMALGFLPDYAVYFDKKNGHAKGFHQYVNYVLRDPGKRAKIMKARLRYLVFSQSFYMTSIREYLEYFPKENIKCIFFEDFIKDQEATCNEIYDFLGIEPDPNVIYNLKSNEGTLAAGPSISNKLGAADMGLFYVLYEFLDLSRKAPKLYKAYEKLHAKIQAFCVREDTDHEKMDPRTRKMLEKYYRKEVKGIERFTGRDLSELWYDAHQYDK